MHAQSSFGFTPNNNIIYVLWMCMRPLVASTALWHRHHKIPWLMGLFHTYFGKYSHKMRKDLKITKQLFSQNSMNSLSYMLKWFKQLLIHYSNKWIIYMYTYLVCSFRGFWSSILHNDRAYYSEWQFPLHTYVGDIGSNTVKNYK